VNATLDIPNPNICPECGAVLPDEAPHGLCPSCLLRPDTGKDGTSVSTEPGLIEPVVPFVQAFTLEKPGDQIDRYKLLQKIGEGGCGIVYMAEQQVPVKRKVALKVIKLGMDTKAVIARFEAERQALALMDHPNIAKVLDGGATSMGRPYFVMELVRGLPITRFCDKNRLTTPQRLALFIHVCQAIQHAHQKGIIHRDVKPSNILVADLDGSSIPKVIDFGISKAITGQTLTDKTLFTAFEQFIGTPAYMSPEQAKLSGLDIDTRSDIYSLGVLLYELLTGRTPFDSKCLAQSGLDEIRRVIQEEDPPRPSTRLSTLDAREQTTVARQRQTEPPKLVGMLRGDLDWIVMKCLDKDRRRRYETANGLAMDVQRFLENDAVLARPPTNLYRFEKLCRRHKLLLGAMAGVMVSLLLGVATTTLEALRASQAERQALGEASRAREAERVAKEKGLIAERERGRAEANLYAADMNLAQQAVEENNLDLAFDLLVKHKPPADASDLRGWEWRYLWARCQSDELCTLGQEVSNIGGLAGSPDGKWLVSACGFEEGDGEVKLWDLASRRVVKTLEKGSPGLSAAYSPDGAFFAFGTRGNGVRIWDATLGKEVNRVPVEQYPRGGCGLAFSCVGNNLAVGDKTGRITLWEPGGKVPIRTFTNHTDAVPSLAFHRDGHTLASASWDNSVKVWDIVSGRQIFNFSTNDSWFQAVAFSPDGSRIAAGDWNGRVHVWSFPDFRPLALLTDQTKWISAVAFSPDGKYLMSAGADYTIRLFETSEWQQIDSLKGDRDEVSAATFSSSGSMIISGDKSGLIKLWPGIPKPRMSVFTPMPPDWMVDKVAAAPDASTIVLAHTNSTLSFWNGPDLRPISRLRLPEFGARLADLAIAPDGKTLVVLAKNGHLWVYDLATAKETVRKEIGDEDYICRFSPGGEALFVGGNDQLTLLDTREYKPIGRFRRSAHSRIVALTFSTELQSLALSTESGVLELWSIRDQSMRTLKAHHGQFIASFVPAGRMLATAGRDGILKLWDCSTLKQISKLGRTSNAFYSIAFSPDGSRIAAGTAYGAIELYDLITGNQMAALNAHTDRVDSLAFTRDDSALVSIGTDGLRVWRAPLLSDR